MNKFFLLLFLTVATSCAYAQLDSLSAEDKRMLDSMFANDEFIKLYLNNNKSYFDISAGVGNGIFSIKNNALNAAQAQTNKIYYTGTAAYFHKTGLSLSLAGFAAAQDGNLQMYQYAVSPAYSYTNKKFTAGVSYTRFIEGSDAGFEVSPFKNDIFASAVYKKTWIQPGLAIGYSFGKQVDYFDTSFWYSPPLGTPRIVHIKDTITSRLSSFLISLSATHKWSFWELLGKKDGLLIQPTVLLNAGKQKWRATHSYSIRGIDFSGRPPLFLKRWFGDGSGSEKFQFQSLGFSTVLTYFIGKFYLQPKIYFDYYLPETTEARLTSLFSVAAGFTFY